MQLTFKKQRNKTYYFLSLLPSANQPNLFCRRILSSSKLKYNSDVNKEAGDIE